MSYVEALLDDVCVGRDRAYAVDGSSQSTLIVLDSIIKQDCFLILRMWGYAYHIHD